MADLFKRDTMSKKGTFLLALNLEFQEELQLLEINYPAFSDIFYIDSSLNSCRCRIED